MNNIFYFLLFVLNKHLSICEIMFQVGFLGKQSQIWILVKRKFIREYSSDQLLWTRKGEELGREEA